MPEIMVAGVKPMKVWLLAATRSRCGRIFFVWLDRQDYNCVWISGSCNYRVVIIELALNSLFVIFN